MTRYLIVSPDHAGILRQYELAPDIVVLSNREMPVTGIQGKTAQVVMFDDYAYEAGKRYGKSSLSLASLVTRARQEPSPDPKRNRGWYREFERPRRGKGKKARW